MVTLMYYFIPSGEYFPDISSKIWDIITSNNKRIIIAHIKIKAFLRYISSGEMTLSIKKSAISSEWLISTFFGNSAPNSDFTFTIKSSV